MSDAKRPVDAGDPTLSSAGLGRERLRRTVPLLKLTARTAGQGVAAGLRSRLTSSDSIEFHTRTAERYAELLGSSKGALMKVGQMVSFMGANPVIPEEFLPIYQTALMRLCSDVPPMPAGLAGEVLERELGRTAESAFVEFDWEPLAAASIGQVHRARLHDGREVAVKIQYPGAAEAIAADLRNAELLMVLLNLALSVTSTPRPRMDLRGAAVEVSAGIAEELDYRLEAASQTEFAEHYGGHPFIHVPQVVDALSTARVLTQELVRGRSWSEALTAGQELRDRWGEAIHRFAFGSVSRLRAINADPHPGNYVFHDDGSVSFLDFGCVNRLDRQQVEMMEVVARECFRNDVGGTWRAAVEAGFFNSSDPVTPEDLFAYLRNDWEMMWAEERFVVTPEYMARWIERRYTPKGAAANVLRHLNVPPELTFMGRMELGVAWVIAQLRAGNLWGSMAAERFVGAAPVTEMGKLEQAFFAQRYVGAR